LKKILKKYIGIDNQCVRFYFPKKASGMLSGSFPACTPPSSGRFASRCFGQ